MKYLLHSRKFKNNLFKWLFCYIGTLVLFTAVVTYSRYITSCAAGSDQAGAAKFKVVVAPSNDICSDGQNSSICNMGSSRAKEYVDFFFTIDTSGLEVSAWIVATVKINENFLEDFEFSELCVFNERGTCVPLNINASNDNGIEATTDGTETLNISENYYVISKHNRTYKVRYFNKKFGDEESYSSGKSFENAFYVGYSATQIG